MAFVLCPARTVRFPGVVVGWLAWIACFVLQSVRLDASDYAQRSVSRSRQFITYCPDIGLRMAVTGYVETLKGSVLDELGQGDHWKLPIVINLARLRTTTTGVPLCQMQIVNTEGGTRLEIDVALREDQFKQVRFPQQVIRALLLELAYRTHPPGDGERYAAPPAWLVEGLAERFQTHATQSEHNSALFQQLIETGRLPKIRDFLTNNVDEMDNTSRAVYDACASSLVEMLVALPGGKSSLSAMVQSLPQAGGDPIEPMLKHFHALGGSEISLQKWWTLGLARESAASRFMGLSLAETEARITPLLKLQVITDEKKGTKTEFALADYKHYLKYRTARAALLLLENGFATVQIRAHPLLRPVVIEYQQIIASLAQGKTGRADASLQEASAYRAMVVARMDKIADYLNWFEATQTPERSGAFDDYLKAAAALDKTAPPKRDDPISRYIDQVQREFE